MKSFTKILDHQAYIQRFGQFLLKKEVISRHELARHLKFQGILDRRIGQLAVLKGFLTLRDVSFVLAMQIEEQKPFGQLAIEHCPRNGSGFFGSIAF